MKKLNIPQSTKAEGVLAFTALLWGMTFIVTKRGLGDASPLIFLSLRFSTAFIIYFIMTGKHFRGLSAKTIKRSILLSVFFFSGYALQTVGLKYTTVAKSALFTYMFVVFVPPLQFFFTGKKPRLLNVAALAVVFTGMLIFTAPGNSSLNIGDWLNLGGAIGYAFFIIFLDRYTGQEDPVVLTGMQFLVSAIIAALMSIFLEQTYVIPTLNLTVSILYLAIPGSVIAIFLMNRFQGMTTPVKACIIYALEPVFTIMFGWLILREALTGSEFFGAALILGGVIFSELIGAIRSRKKIS
ncbi:MAG: DMT family transporter [Spirochaetales bacterium]|uniref:DMT family transporter n=1 Tax=Candidatus Thalassospirochaeta sargassi TaxID=3119039 RepID=A0AAJ1IHK9_9SPIO|nr:DMT family transporter [Spirochaetales bacterium]